MFEFSAEKLDTAELRSRLADSKAGAVAIFEGIVRNRNEGKAVSLLEYEAYEQLAEREALKILQEARTKFGTFDQLCVHRTGRLEVGETAVWVGVLAEHRGEAFDACRYIIDEVKHRLPIWKKEHYVDGDSGWVNCQSHSHADEGSALQDQPYPWQLDIWDVSSAELSGFLVVDITAHKESQPAARHLWSLIRCDVKNADPETFLGPRPPIDIQVQYLFVCPDGDASFRLVKRLRQIGYENVFCLLGGASSLRRKFLA